MMKTLSAAAAEVAKASRLNSKHPAASSQQHHAGVALVAQGPLDEGLMLAFVGTCWCLAYKQHPSSPAARLKPLKPVHAMLQTWPVCNAI